MRLCDIRSEIDLRRESFELDQLSFLRLWQAFDPVDPYACA